jgi:penicillin-binding protein 2
VAKALVSPEGNVLRRIAPKKAGRVTVSKAHLRFIDDALGAVTAPGGTMNWKLQGFPLDKVKIRAKTGSAEVYGKQSTGWVASYNEDYVVVMMISQGGTGSGSVGEGIRAVWESLYGIKGEQVVPARSAIPGVVAGDRLPTFTDDGSILPPDVVTRPKKER